jgi:hypothetical protein
MFDEANVGNKYRPLSYGYIELRACELLFTHLYDTLHPTPYIVYLQACPVPWMYQMKR